jgi:hypothetical protein
VLPKQVRSTASQPTDIKLQARDTSKMELDLHYHPLAISRPTTTPKASMPSSNPAWSILPIMARWAATTTTRTHLMGNKVKFTSNASTRSG